MDSTDLGRGHKKLWQYKNAFRSGEDAVALVRFANASWRRFHPEHEPKSLLDIGCGAGMIISLLADDFPEALAFGIEKVERLAKLAHRNLAEQGLAKRALIIMKDARLFTQQPWPWGALDLLVCNPPYRKGLPRGGIAAAAEQLQGGSLQSLAPIADNLCLERQVARFDFALDTKDLAQLGARLMQEEACFCLVFPLNRQAELVSAMEAERLFLSRWCRLCGWAGKAPKQGLYCFTRWNEKGSTQADDMLLRDENGGCVMKKKGYRKESYD